VGALLAASDVYLGLGQGGAWEMVQSQALACGTPNVTLNYAGCTEFINQNNSYLVPYYLHCGGYHVDRALADEKEVVKQLELAYTDKVLWQAKSTNAIQTVEKYSWDRCAHELHLEIQDTLRKDPNRLYAKRIN
jgi:glycosyltransferase involved in cell wall biosynthesis